MGPYTVFNANKCARVCVCLCVCVCVCVCVCGCTACGCFRGERQHYIDSSKIITHRLPLTPRRQNALATLKALAEGKSPAASLVAAEATKGPDRDLAKLLNLPFLHLIRWVHLCVRGAGACVSA
jgi:hypothetical protein